MVYDGPLTSVYTLLMIERRRSSIYLLIWNDRDIAWSERLCSKSREMLR